MLLQYMQIGKISLKSFISASALCNSCTSRSRIKPDGVGTQSSTLCEFTDLECWLRAVVNVLYEPSIQSGVQFRVKDFLFELHNRSQALIGVRHWGEVQGDRKFSAQ
jgi:hypothetical protein